MRVNPLKSSTFVPRRISCRDPQKNVSERSTAVISGKEHQGHKNSCGRQVASFQYAKCCSSTVSHPSFCIWRHSKIRYICISPKHNYLHLAWQTKRKSCIKIFKAWRSLSEFSSRVQFWGPQGPSVSFFTISGSINLTCYLCCQQGQYNKHKSNPGTEQESRTKKQAKV